jgi:hypothetical protein
MARRFVPIAWILASLFSGCESASSPSAPRNTSAAEHARRYAELPGLAGAPHPGLKAELALLQAEGMTPAALDQRLATASAEAGGSQQATGGLLGAAIPPISRPLLTAQLDAVYAGGPLALSPVELERGREVLLRCTAERQRFREALEAASASPLLLPSDGALADLQFLDAVRLGCRLEAIAAADALAENEPEQAVMPLATILRAAKLLAREWNLTTRLAAANLRGDGLCVLAAIAAHERTTQATHERLLALVERETADWPPDAAAWIGERAAGLTTYELVRDGHYLSLLDSSETQKLRESGLLAATAKAVMRNIDADEHFYLQSMRRMIEACRQPYYQRAAVLDEIRRDLAARDQTGHQPLIAGRLLLADFEAAHQRQAEDLAAALAWKLALAAAAGRQPRETALNPLTGQPLAIEITEQGAVVAGYRLPDGGPLAAPLRGPALEARRTEPARARLHD